MGWFLLNLLQAAFSPLDADEAYYWMYAGQLDWGYFDHPPAVAVLIALGRDWLPGTLGLRFGHVLAGTVTLAATFALLEPGKRKWAVLAAALLLAQPMLNVYGFIATPDGPLLLFTALYLLAYRRFLRTPDLVSGGVWGLTMAGLLYSKYHGVVLILFSVLPNFGWLIRRPGAWVAVLGGAALYLPHLYWQYANDYPSFRYHLGGRDDPYQFKFTTGYLLNQLLIFSPLLTYHFARAVGLRRPAGDRFGSACRWLVIGFLIFFLWTTTKGRTEAQWTAALFIPLTYLLFTATRRRFPTWRPLLLKLCYATIALLFVGRLALMAPRDWLPFAKPFDHAPWVERLAARAGDLPVVFENSYRYASLYTFYSGGRPAWTFTDIDYRPNQYDLWDGDQAYHNQPALIVGQENWNYPAADTFRLNRSTMRVAKTDNLQIVRTLRFQLDGIEAGQTVGRTVPVRVTALQPANRSDLPLRLRAGLRTDLMAIARWGDDEKSYWTLAPVKATALLPGQPVELFAGDLAIPAGVPAGVPVLLSIGLAYEGMPPLRGQGRVGEVVVR